MWQQRYISSIAGDSVNCQVRIGLPVNMLYVGVSVEVVTVHWRMHAAAETREVGHASNVVFQAEYIFGLVKCIFILRNIRTLCTH